MQAFAEGRVIECRTKPSTVEGTDVPNDWTEMKEIEYWNNTEYRIKPEAKFRPFANAEECWDEMMKHQPFGWVKNEIDGTIYSITSIIKCENMAFVSRVGSLNFRELMTLYTFADGTPFCIKEEE